MTAHLTFDMAIRNSSGAIGVLFAALIAGGCVHTPRVQEVTSRQEVDRTLGTVVTFSGMARNEKDGTHVCGRAIMVRLPNEQPWQASAVDRRVAVRGVISRVGPIEATPEEHSEDSDDFVAEDQVRKGQRFWYRMDHVLEFSFN